MKTALVGGGSKGLGLAAASSLAARGYRVIVCARTSGDLEKASDHIRVVTNNPEVVPFRCDFSKRESLQSLGEFLNEKQYPIDVLINNVGGPQPGKVTELSEEDWERGLDLLFRSTLRLYAMVVPGMKERRWGRIINILSPAAVEPAPTLAISSVLRAGLVNYAKLFSKEAGQYGITVNSIMPGGFRTARTEQLERDTAERRKVSVETVQKENEAGIPIQRMLAPEELGGLIVYLASDEAAGMTGALIPIDGGQMRT
jgi:3-oxoacyl-[acyl-carrier protein] reductase